MTGIDWPRPGIHDGIAASDYHADPCREPSLSAGVAHKLISRSPLHAWHSHPRLNPDHIEQEAAHLDFGTAAHSILLEGLDICTVIEGFDDWRKQAARDQRDEARATGLIPLLAKDYERMQQLVRAIRDQIGRLDIDPLPLCAGKPEQTLIWKEPGDVWCRARIDWLHDTGLHIADLKTTRASASPREWARRRLFADGKDTQCAFYLRGYKTLTGHDAEWRFVVAETEPPYGLSVISLTPAALELASRKVDRAITKWRECLTEDRWPCYPLEVAYAEPPAWAEADLLQAEYEETAA